MKMTAGGPDVVAYTTMLNAYSAAGNILTNFTAKCKPYILSIQKKVVKMYAFLCCREMG